MEDCKEMKPKENVVLQLQNETGEVFYELVCKTRLSQASDFFQAFFKHSIPLDSPNIPRLLPHDAQGLKIYHLFLQTTNKEATRNLLMSLETGVEVELTLETVDAIMKQADAWNLQSVQSVVESYLRKRVVSITNRNTTEGSSLAWSLCQIVEVEQLLDAAIKYRNDIWSKSEYHSLSEQCNAWKWDTFFSVFGVGPYLTWEKSDNVILSPCRSKRVKSAKDAEAGASCFRTRRMYILNPDPEKQGGRVGDLCLSFGKGFARGVVYGSIASLFLMAIRHSTVGMEASLTMDT
eukprot:g1456.t1